MNTGMNRDYVRKLREQLNTTPQDDPFEQPLPAISSHADPILAKQGTDDSELFDEHDLFDDSTPTQPRDKYHAGKFPLLGPTLAAASVAGSHAAESDFGERPIPTEEDSILDDPFPTPPAGHDPFGEEALQKDPLEYLRQEKPRLIGKLRTWLAEAALTVSNLYDGSRPAMNEPNSQTTTATPLNPEAIMDLSLTDDPFEETYSYFQQMEPTPQTLGELIPHVANELVRHYISDDPEEQEDPWDPFSASEPIRLLEYLKHYDICGKKVAADGGTFKPLLTIIKAQGYNTDSAEQIDAYIEHHLEEELLEALKQTKYYKQKNDQ